MPTAGWLQYLNEQFIVLSRLSQQPFWQNEPKFLNNYMEGVEERRWTSSTSQLATGCKMGTAADAAQGAPHSDILGPSRRFFGELPNCLKAFEQCRSAVINTGQRLAKNQGVAAGMFLLKRSWWRKRRFWRHRMPDD